MTAHQVSKLPGLRNRASSIPAREYNHSSIFLTEEDGHEKKEATQVYLPQIQHPTQDYDPNAEPVKPLDPEIQRIELRDTEPIWGNSPRPELKKSKGSKRQPKRSSMSAVRSASMSHDDFMEHLKQMKSKVLVKGSGKLTGEVNLSKE